MIKKINEIRLGLRSIVRIFIPALMVAGSYSTATAQTTYNPARYYTFNGASAGTDSMGVSNLNFTTYNSPYTVESNGQVGKFLTLNSSSALIDGGALSLTNAITIEFLIKPGSTFNTSKIIQRGDNAFAVQMEYPRITFTTNHKSAAGASISDDMIIELDGIGRKSYGYYTDNNWHHLVFRFDGTTGLKSVWVDGQCPTGFSKTLTTGTFSNTGNYNFYLNHSISYVKYFGSIDELALYTTAIPDLLIYKHYLGVQSGTTYNGVNNYSGTIPAASAVTAGLDPNEFAPGYPSTTVTATNQLLSFPGPRYKTGHTLHPNIPLYGVEYLASMNQTGVTYTQILNSAKIQQVDLINNFNQSILVMSNTHEYAYLTDTTKFAGWFLKYANANPTKHTSAFTFWPSVNPSLIGRSSTASYATCNCLSANYYLRNSSGQFLDMGGNVTTYKYLSPASPVDSLAIDGLTQRFYLTQLVSKLTRPLDLLFENGEVIPLFYNSSVIALDPTVVTDKNNTGLDWSTYEGRRAKEKAQAYSNQFMSLTQLANTKFVYYGTDGQPTYRHKYSEMRLASTPMNGQVYPSGDIYMRYPNNWRYWVSSWHGWQWVAESRKVEIALGDKLFSPPVSPGWDIDETMNVRPGQWLGMLKTFSMAGAEFFYPSFFNLTAPYQDSKNWAWQVVMPAYSQAISSRYEDLLRNGYLMEGDVPNDYVNPTYNAYSFNAGDLRKLVVIRKHNTLAKYGITGTIQPNSNMIGNAENTSVATITLDGQTLKFKVRRQGSTYIYDKTNAASPIFYQLDEWHEATHPYYWSRDFVFEAELFDNTNANAVIKTTVPAGTTAGDYTNFTTAVGFNAASDLIFNFLPRLNAPTTQYLWVRARSKNGTTTGFTVMLNGAGSQTFDCIKDTNWVWYRYTTTSAAAVFNGITTVDQALKITALNTNLEIDKIHLTSNSGAVYAGVPNPCSTSQASISASGATSFCAGGSVTLTASAGTTYLWSTGATTQAISATSSGTYTVTVTTSGTPSTASPVTVTVFAAPNAAITAGGATTFCSGGSVTLTASAGSSYLWSPGNQTTQAVTINAGGTYNVRVTDANGCSKISANTTVTVNALPTATVTAGGATTFCSGGSVTLTASAGSSYLWSPGNQTTQAVTVSAGGSYNVRVTNANGCSATSSNTTVTVNSLPTATITPSGSLSLTTGQSVTLTSSAGSSYLWSPGNQTTQAITVSTAGSYTVRVTNASGCTAVSSAAVVTVGTAPTATITASGATSFCSGGSVSLTASTGNSYLWSTGATTKSISATTSGSYTVTVTTNGVPAVSAPTAVTVWSLPTATITASGSTTICSGSSVTLTASTGSSYLWSPGGQTTQSISVTAGGNYNVRVTNSNGCSATSANTAVTVTTCTGTCAMPTGLTTVSVTSTSATIRWTNPNSGQTSFQVKLKDMAANYTYTAGTVPSTTTQITVGASSGTTYRWWVRSWCGSATSAYAGFLTYTTSAARENELNEVDAVTATPATVDQNSYDDATTTNIDLKTDEVLVFPNPASESSNITFSSVNDEVYTLNILEANGKLVRSEKINAMEGFNIFSFNTEQLPRGIYFIQLTGNSNSVIKRLAIQ